MMKIWAHRGCSLLYPENTITAFSKAVQISGLAGIELDIQMTKDGQIVVCHDERVDRTTDGIGELRDFQYAQLRRLKINAPNGHFERIPAIDEVLDLLEGRLKDGMQLNIELKNSVFAYEGMEQKIIDIVYSRGLGGSVVYSSFCMESVGRIVQIDPGAQTGILAEKVSDCMGKRKGRCADSALHPYWKAIDLPREELTGYTVRAWLTGYLYPQKPTGKRLDLNALERIGITDLFLNEPEQYCK